ncbi:MAG TPA: hypothetical protein EYN67_03725 [Flavobacteriales bacterium]|nr:hypothetical protein [Flavobacteriales bacterium]
MKYYISQTIVEMVDGRLIGREVVLTRADSRVKDSDGTRYKNVKLFMHKMRAIGIENLHINKYEKKRYNRLIREQNKRHKVKQLTMADLAKMTEQADKELSDNHVGGE